MSRGVVGVWLLWWIIRLRWGVSVHCPLDEDGFSHCSSRRRISGYLSRGDYLELTHGDKKKNRVVFRSRSWSVVCRHPACIASILTYQRLRHGRCQMHPHPDTIQHVQHHLHTPFPHPYSIKRNKLTTTQTPQPTSSSGQASNPTRS